MALAVKLEPTVSVTSYSKEQVKSFYRTMRLIRTFEQTIEEHFLAGEIPGFVHLYIGEEAIATGLMANMTHKDYIESTHRGHGHTIAKGADLKRMMAEIFGKSTGYCKGKGGSMHIADFNIGMLGANGVVGGGYTLATGAALASKMLDDMRPEAQKEHRISTVFFGDGASNRGTFHEALNMAAAWHLPALFVCEMNCWASTTPYRTTTSVENIADRCQGYSVPGYIVDGNDVFAVYEAGKKIVEDLRAGKGPILLECKTYRIKGHFVGDPERYRTKEEVAKVWKENNAITRFKEKVIPAGMMTEEDCNAIDQECKDKIAEALKFAQESPEPEASALFEDLYV